MIHVGTSGWQYRSWKDRFYPKGVPQRAWLRHYASRFPVVEVTNTFYMLPKEPAFEFREPSWWRDDVFEALDQAGAAWVLADRPGARVREIVTGGWTYIRFHQGRPAHPGYTRQKLRAWADRIAALAVPEAFVFFNNDPLAAAPRDALVLEELLAQRRLEVAQPPAADED